MVTPPADTLVCDTAKIIAWQSDPAYAYNRELIAPDVNLLEWLNRWVGEILQKILGSSIAEKYSGYVLIGIFILILLSVIWFVYRKRPELFVRSSKKNLPYTVEEDVIYGVDFEKGIEEALLHRDYRTAIRLLYLQTLKILSDQERIDWQIYKTPSQYIYEVKMPAFRKLTLHFLEVRYGNFEATEVLFRSMQALQKEIEKGAEV